VLEGLEFLLGVTGGIAAYKACELARMFIREGARVRAVLTPRATEFVTPLTFAALTGQACLVDAFPGSSSQPQTDPYSHLNLTRDLACYVIAPATANTLAKLAVGQADNLVTACYLSCQAPVVIAPAMNERMWAHPATQLNVTSLQQHGAMVVLPDSGALACGDEGAGRLADLSDIFHAAVSAATAPHSLPSLQLQNKHIVVTAGGTREYLDPVRFLTNASTGTLGILVAQELIKRGADVTLVETGISLPVGLKPQLRSHHVVLTSFDLLQATTKLQPEADAIVMLAAVADYGPAKYLSNKRKKTGDIWTVEFTETPDILATLAQQRQKGQVLVGVSLEDTDWVQRAMKKTASKRVDAMLAVELSAELPFGDRELNCALVTADNIVAPPEIRPKTAAAELLSDSIAAQLIAQSSD